MNTKTLVATLAVILVVLGVVIFQGLSIKNKIAEEKLAPTVAPTGQHVRECPAQFECYSNTKTFTCKDGRGSILYLTCDAGKNKIGYCCPKE